jgi:flagellar hook-associated protein 3 FlgL
MRITNQMVTDANTKYMLDSLESINKAQKQVNSQKLFDIASEDPLAASFSLSLNSTLRTLKTFQDTTVSVGNWMNASEYAFQQMNDLSMQASNLILSGLNDTIGVEERATMAIEIDSMLSQALETANTTHDGQYIFSGFRTDEKPFALIDHSQLGDLNPGFVDLDTGVATYEIAYSGDDGKMMRSINVGQTVTQNVTGREAFEGFLQYLVMAREALKAPNSSDTTMLSNALAGLKTTTATMSSMQGASASRWRQVQSTSDLLDQSTMQTQSLLSQNEDINLAQGITELRKQESNYQVVMEVTSRAISAMTLFDYLR